MKLPHRISPLPMILALATCLLYSLGPASPAVSRAEAEPWLHIKVIETGPDGETVHVNVPLSLVEAMAPMMNQAALEAGDDSGDEPGDGHGNDGDQVETSHSHHHHGLRLNHHDMSPAEMRALLEAFQKAEDGEYVTVEGADEHVRVTKSGGYFLVDVDDHGADREQVKVKMRMEVIQALLSGGPDELDFAAATRALRSQSGEDLVTVTSSEETVRIWIDEKKTND